jgi:hypothetical protein
MEQKERIGSVVLLGLALVVSGAGCDDGVMAGDISALDQHFNRPGRSIAPWTFGPAGNIKEFSTEEHPGLATIYEAGRGQDIKGILDRPIRIA